MRLLLTFLFLLHYFKPVAQTEIDSSTFSAIHYPIKGFVLLNSGEKIMIEGINITNRDKVHLFIPGSNMLNGAYTYKGDVRTMQIQTIPIADIKLLKVKRQSFALGSAYGGLGGFVVGYAGGALTYNEDIYIDEEDNKSNRNVRGLLFGIGLGIPTALAGGFVGGLFIKKRFQINGDALYLENTLLKVLRQSL